MRVDKQVLKERIARARIANLRDNAWVTIGVVDSLYGEFLEEIKQNTVTGERVTHLIPNPKPSLFDRLFKRQASE